jgi:hypothetical protein
MGMIDLLREPLKAILSMFRAERIPPDNTESAEDGAEDYAIAPDGTLVYAVCDDDE